MRLTIRQARQRLVRGEVSSVDLTAAAVARIEDPAGEGARAFIGGASATAMAQAEAADRLMRAGQGGPLAGLPISIKDLFDVRGEVTRAGSRVLDEGPAAADSAVAARLRAAGAVLVGRSNMSEFAYTGLGINPHFGTPRNPWDRAAGRIPGGSSSGAAVAVADGMAAASIGTDTGGSCRVPAALCGLVGFKPTRGRIPVDGMVPLAASYDTVGSLANSVACCALLDQVLRGVPATPLRPVKVAGLRIGVPTNHMQDELAPSVAQAFADFRALLAAHGAQLSDVHLDSLARLRELNAQGGIIAAEAYAWHRHRLPAAASAYDPRILARIESGAVIDASQYAALVHRRAALTQLFDAEAAPFDVLAMPTVPIEAPRIVALDDDGEYFRVNRLMLRNTGPANAFDACAVSLPHLREGGAPVGMMLMGRRGTDHELLSIADAISACMREDRRV